MTDRRRRLLGIAGEVIETVVISVLLVVLMQAFVVQTYAVEQWSMENTLQVGERIGVDELTPRFGGYHRGDIIVFNPPEGYEAGDGIPFVKRVIGVVGDRIAIRDGRVEVNGKTLDEPYVYEHQPTTVTGDASSWMVPEGALFVMGDHRAVSMDSRVFGPIQVERVIGRVWMRYFPLDSIEVLQTPVYPNLSPSPS